MFFSLLKGEFKKMLKPRALIILAIVLVLAFILMIVVFTMFSSLDTILSGMQPEEGVVQEGDVPSGEETFTLPNLKIIVSEAVANETLGGLRAQLAEFEAWKKTNPQSYYAAADNIYATKAMISAIEYVKANNLYGQDIGMYLGEGGSVANAVAGQPTGYDFVDFSMSILGLIIVFYMITVAASIFVQELKNGSIKLLMIRPVSRNEVMSAKLAAVAIYGACLYLVCFLVSLLYGGIRYGLPVTAVMYVFNATTPILATPGFGLFLTALSGIMTIFTFSLLSYTAANLFRNSGAGMCVGIIGATGILQLLFTALGGVRFLLSYQTLLTAYFSLSGTGLYGGSDFFLCVGMLSVYWIIMLAANYFVFQKRDIA